MEAKCGYLRYESGPLFIVVLYIVAKIPIPHDLSIHLSIQSEIDDDWIIIIIIMHTCIRPSRCFKACDFHTQPSVPSSCVALRCV